MSRPGEAKIGKNKISFLVPQIRDRLRSHDCPQHNDNSKICLNKVLETNLKLYSGCLSIYYISKHGNQNNSFGATAARYIHSHIT